MIIHQCSDCHAVLEKKSYGYFCIPCYVRRSCTEQGLPTKVTDPVVLHDVAVLLTAKRPR